MISKRPHLIIPFIVSVISVAALFLFIRNLFLLNYADNLTKNNHQHFDMGNYSRYAVKRLGLAPLKNQRHLIGSNIDSGEPIINDITLFHYHINPSAICEDSDLDFMVLIISAPENEEKRNVLRQTWLKQLNSRNRTDYAFFVGLSKYKEVQKAIEKENDNYGDIIQLEMTDSYYRLTLKTVALLHWTINFCPNADYILKVDDDVYVNVDNLVFVIEKMDPTSPPSIYGAEVTFDNLPERSLGMGLLFKFFSFLWHG